jgi:hypothetical protein
VGQAARQTAPLVEARYRLVRLILSGLARGPLRWPPRGESLDSVSAASSMRRGRLGARVTARPYPSPSRVGCRLRTRLRSWRISRGGQTTESRVGLVPLPTRGRRPPPRGT